MPYKYYGYTGGGGGGGGGDNPKPIPESEIENAAIVFTDYDGTVLYAYSKEQAAALTSLPDNPDHSTDDIPLTSQGWNWTLEEIKAQLESSPDQMVQVGQLYIPTDNKTHFMIYIEPDTPIGRRDMTIRFKCNMIGSVEIDWGDGATELNTATAETNYDHVYQETGWYDITLSVKESELPYEQITLGGSGDAGTGVTHFSVFGPRTFAKMYLQNRIRHVRIGSNIYTLSDGQFCRCYKLEDITIPNTYISFGAYEFYSCSALNHLVVPKISDGVIGMSVCAACSSLKNISIPYGIYRIRGSAFISCQSLTYITIPDTVRVIDNSVFDGCGALRAVRLPNNLASVSDYAFRNCFNLTKIIIPDTVKNIGNYAFQYCRSLHDAIMHENVNVLGQYAFGACECIVKVVVPANVNRIDSNCFNNCSSVKEYYFRSETPPTLGNNNVFALIPSDCIIYVPYSEDHSILEAYKAATYWKNYASYMQEEQN